MTRRGEYVEQGFDLESWPDKPVPDDCSHGLQFTFSEDELDYRLSTISRWFDQRPEVSLIASGTTDKQGLGCIVMEWDHCKIDKLFLDILNTDENIIDYVPYPIEEVEG